MYTQTVCISLGPARTGLTLTLKLFDAAGVQSGADMTTGIAEIGSSGDYVATVSVPDAFRGTLRVYNGSTYLAAAAVNPETAEYAARILSVVQAADVS